MSRSFEELQEEVSIVGVACALVYYIFFAISEHIRGWSRHYIELPVFNFLIYHNFPAIAKWYQERIEDVTGTSVFFWGGIVSLWIIIKYVRHTRRMVRSSAY